MRISMNHDSKRWITLLVCMVSAMCGGFAYAWSVFQKPLMSLFQWSAADMSLSFTLIMSTGAIVAIFAGKALDYLQVKQLLLIGGVCFGAAVAGIGFVQSLPQLYGLATMAGVGVGIIYPGATMANIVRYFPDRPGMVSGLLAAGYGLGGVMWAPVSAALISVVGVLTALKILGSCFLLIVTIASRVVSNAPDGYRPLDWQPAAGSGRTGAGVDKTWQEMLKNPAFYLIAAVFALGGITGMMVIGHASPIVQTLLGVTPQAAAGIVGLLLVANTGGKVFWGWLSDKVGRNPVVLMLFALGAAAMAVLPVVQGYYITVGIVLTVGLCYGGFLAIMAPITASLFGTKNLGINFGIMFLTIGIAAYVGPLMAAVITQANSGDYSKAFVIAAVINLAGIGFFTAFNWYHKCQSARRVM